MVFITVEKTGKEMREDDLESVLNKINKEASTQRVDAFFVWWSR